MWRHAIFPVAKAKVTCGTDHCHAVAQGITTCGKRDCHAMTVPRVESHPWLILAYATRGHEVKSQTTCILTVLHSALHY